MTNPAAVLTVSEGDRLGPVPLNVNDVDSPVWHDTPEPPAGRQLFQPRHQASPCRAVATVRNSLGAAAGTHLSGRLGH
jgi:hypothetical protein